MLVFDNMKNQIKNIIVENMHEMIDNVFNMHGDAKSPITSWMHVNEEIDGDLQQNWKEMQKHHFILDAHGFQSLTFWYICFILKI